MRRPFGISLIGYFYIMGSIIILLTLGIEQTINFNVRFGIPFVPESIFRIILSIYSLVLAYGYLKMYKWGYWNMTLYSSLFLFISIGLIIQYETQPFIGNAIFSTLILVYTLRNRHSFIN